MALTILVQTAGVGVALWGIFHTPGTTGLHLNETAYLNILDESAQTFLNMRMSSCGGWRLPSTVSRTQFSDSVSIERGDLHHECAANKSVNMESY